MFSLDELQHYPVNWRDGMRVSAKDFVATDEAWNDALRDVRASLMQGVQYGLLPPPVRDSSDKSAYPKFKLDPLGSELTLLECRAITEGGYRIEITEDLHRTHKVPAQLPTAKMSYREDVDVYITVELFRPQEAGKMSSDAPPRGLYVCPLYELSVIPKSEGIGLSGINHLKIAEFKWAKGAFLQDENYIPPCLTVNAHAELLQCHHRAGGLLKSICENSIPLLSQYHADTRSDVRDATAWVERVVIHISSMLWTYNDLLPWQSPRHTIVFFKNWAQLTFTTAHFYESNKYIESGLKSQGRLFKNLTDSNFSDDDLRTAFIHAEEALKGQYKWFKALFESFKQQRVIPVEEIRV